MNWDAIGAFGEMIGSVAVLTTLGYLAVQIRQSNRLENAELELTQFHGHLILSREGVRDAHIKTAVPGRVPPADR